MYRRLQPLPGPWCRRERCAVPPSPQLMRSLLQRYADLTPSGACRRRPFKQWFDIWASSRRGEKSLGLDDGRLDHAPRRGGADDDQPADAAARRRGAFAGAAGRLSGPPARRREHARRISSACCSACEGEFVSRLDARLLPAHQRLLPPTRGIDVQGEVFGWFRLPQPLDVLRRRQLGHGRRLPAQRAGHGARRGARGARCGRRLPALRRARRAHGDRVVRHPRRPAARRKPAIAATSGATSG